MKKRILPLTVILLTLCAATQAITAQVAPQVESIASSTDSETVVKSAPLYGKTINVIGDSYVKNHKRPFTEAWHYLVAEKYHMIYRNYGRNGRCLVFNREAEKWGKPKGTLEQFETGLDSLCRGLIAKYPTAKLAFVTPWRVPRPCFNEVIGIMVKVCGRYSIPVFNAAERSGIYVWDAQFRKLFFQGPNDTAHLNARGHRLFMRKGESFLLGL